MIRRLIPAALLLLVALPVTAQQNAQDSPNPWISREIYRRYAIGTWLAKNGDWSGAYHEYERAWRLWNRSGQLTARVAEALYRTQRPAEAEKFAQRAVEIDSSLAEPWLILGELALQRNDFREADRAFAHRVRARPDDLESRLKLGLIRESLGDDSGAAEAFRGYPRRRPGAAIANFHLGIVLVRLDRPREARRAFREALQENSRYIEAAENYAILTEELESETEAIEAWRAAHQIDATRPEPLRRLARLFVTAGRAVEAIESLKSLLEIIPDKRGEVKRLLASLALSSGDLASAAHAYFSLARGARTETGYIEAALIAAQAGSETDLLVTALDEAYRLGRRPQVALLLYRARLAANRETEAFALLASLPHDAIEDTAILWSMAVLHHRRGGETEAAAIFQRLIAIDPDNAEALNYVGYTWAEQGVRLERAEEYIRRALAIDPENPQFIDSLGWVLFQRGFTELALIQLERAHALLPDEPVIMEHLGDVYRRLQRPDKARAMYEASIEKAPEADRERLKEKIRELIGDPEQAVE